MSGCVYIGDVREGRDESVITMRGVNQVRKPLLATQAPGAGGRHLGRMARVCARTRQPRTAQRSAAQHRERDCGGADRQRRLRPFTTPNEILSRKGPVAQMVWLVLVALSDGVHKLCRRGNVK